MSTYTQILYQIVFATKNRDKFLNKNNRERLFKDIWGILKNKKCHLYRINGVENHLPIITHIHPMIALASLVKDIKLGSSTFIKESNCSQALKDGRKAMVLLPIHLSSILKIQGLDEKPFIWGDDFFHPFRVL